MPNVELLRKTLEHIEANPDAWDQEHWAKQTECGTAYCFAGTALMLAGKVDFAWCTRAHDGLMFASEMTNGEDIAEVAGELLGLDMLSADILFDPRNNLAQLRRMVGSLTAGHERPHE